MERDRESRSALRFCFCLRILLNICQQIFCVQDMFESLRKKKRRIYLMAILPVAGMLFAISAIVYISAAKTAAV